MTAAAAAALFVLLVSATAVVRCSVDDFQCACGHDARRHVQTVRATLDGGRATAAAVANEAAAYGTLVRRMLFVANGRPEPADRWLWLLDLYANGARRQLDRGDGEQTARETLSEAVDEVRGQLDRYMKICEARGVAGFARHWSHDRFEKYLLERVTATASHHGKAADSAAGDEAQQQAEEDGDSETDFEPDRLYLNDVAARGGTALADLMPRDVGIDWGDAADRLAGLYSKARRKWVSGTPELVLYQKKFVSAVVATVAAHVLVHIEHCYDYWREGGGGGRDSIDDGDSSYVGEYERTWMSVGSLLEKFQVYLDLRGSESCFKVLVDVAGNPVRDDGAFLVAKRAIRAHVADIGGGLFGPAPLAAVVPAIEIGGTAPESSALIDLIALVDNNIGAAEKYMATVQALLPNVRFKIINKFMRNTHIWLT